MALHYELEVLDELISEDLHPKNVLKGNTIVTDKQVSAWLNKAVLLKRKARKRIRSTAYSFLEEKHKKIYINQHISSLIRLLDTLFNYLSPKEVGDMAERKEDLPAEKLYKRLYSYCLHLLNYLHDHFSECFNPNFKMPEYEFRKSQHEWRNNLSSLKRKLLRLKADRKLVDLLFTFLNDFCDPANNTSFSFSSHRYINDLLSGLESLGKMRKINSQCPPLNLLLVYLDFNETSIKDYMVQRICENVNPLKTVKEKVDKLYFYYKEISQMHRKPGISFYPQASSIKEDLKDWLAREIKYLEKSQTLGIIVPAKFQDVPQYKRGIWYTYTIEELALLQRAQHEAGYITNTNIIALMEDLSKIAHTATQHNISYKNLKNLFYNIDLDTIDSLHDKLLIMIRKLQNLKAITIRKQKTKQSHFKK
ncbi:MAG TPA: hypothetical protein VHD35_06870 [Chitinophagaceae bacterium]|nr:hypothetical protein [Chitinophagaceae bacterium]